MRLVLAIYFILNIILVNAQDKQDIPSCTQILTGEVREKISTDILPESIVVLSDNEGNVIETQMVKEDGIFSFSIKCKTEYKLEGKKAEFTSESTNFTTDDNDGKVLKLLILLDKGNIDFITDAKAKKVEADTLIKTEEIKPVDLPEITPDVVVTPRANANVLTIDPVLFDYESSWLNQKAKNELQKVIDLMKEKPEMVLECGGHTDSKGTDSYNQWMSDRRAKRVVDYITNQGIDSNRITGKGYGEKMPINECDNNIKCTDAQRAVNRRVDITIVKM